MCSRKGWFLSNEEIVGTASMMNLTHTNLLQVTLQTFFFSVLINDNRSTNCVSKLLLLNSMGYHHRLPLLLEMRDGEAICFFFCLLLPAYVQPREPLFAGWIYFSLSLCGPVHCSKRETGGVFFPFFLCYPPGPPFGRNATQEERFHSFFLLITSSSLPPFLETQDGVFFFFLLTFFQVVSASCNYHITVKYLRLLEFTHYLWSIMMPRSYQ